MARILRSLAAASLVLAFAVPAMSQEASCRLIRGAETPDDPTDDVQVCRQDVWFHANQAKLGNLGAHAGGFPMFNGTKPSASVTTGAGGGYIASSALHQGGFPFDPQATATFDGTFTGDIDTLAVTMFLFSPQEDVQSIPTIAINTRVLVDGQVLFETGGNEIPRGSGGQAAKRIDFAFTGLYQPLVDAGLNGPGREHQIRFQIMGTGLATESALFVYDTTEVPSGMVFNIEPENLGPYTVISAG